MPSTEEAARDLEAFKQAAAELGSQSRDSSVFRRALLLRIAPRYVTFRGRYETFLREKVWKGEKLTPYQKAFLHSIRTPF